MAILMSPTVGAAYNFTFASGYDTFNGIYKVSRIMTYDEYVDDGGDIDTDFFTPNGKSDEVENELEHVRESMILKLVSPDTDDDSDPVFAPMYYLEGTPDYNVKKYQNIGIIANIGITEKVEDVDFIREIITEAVESALGITPSPKLVVTKEQWMTEAQYQEILKNRDESKKKVMNYYSENLKLEKMLSSANTKLKEYEKLIINQQKQIDNLKVSHT